MSTGLNKLLTPAELHSLGQYSLQSRYVVEGSLAGRHRSPARGSSAEFAEHRAYVSGDDLKHLDWKVLGRTERYYIRRYEDETNLRVYLVLDRSASMAYTSGPETKYHYACRLAAAVGYVVAKARDAVGLFLYADTIQAQLEPLNSILNLNNLASTMLRQGPSSTTRTARTLHQIAEAIQRRGLIVLFSDLLDEPAEIVRALAHFRQQHHDVIIFHTLDPAEIDFPFEKNAEFLDLETGARISADPRSLASEYRRVFAEFLEQYRKPCAEMKIDYRLVNTGQTMDRFLRAYLEERRRLAK